MAKTDRDLFDTLRASGLRKSAATNLSKAFGKADNSPPSKGAKKAVSDLRDAVSDLESRVRRTDRKRSEAAKKAAATRKRKASQRSTAAKKAAQTRAKNERSPKNLRYSSSRQVDLAQQDRLAVAAAEEAAQVAQQLVRVDHRAARHPHRLEHERDGVDAEAAEALLEPEPDDLRDLVADLRVGHVEVGLVGVEAVEVVLARLAS